MRDTRPSPAELAAKGRARVRSRGPREALGAWLARAPDTLFSRARLLFFARVTAGEPRHAARPGLELRRATPDDGARYEMCVGTDSARTFARRLTAETDCYIVVAGDDILHASWVTRGAAWTREVRRYVVPRPGDAYVYESFTVTGARGRGIYPFALTGICMSLSQRDTTMLWVAIEDRNLASLRAVTKAGFEVQTEVSYSRRMGVTTVRPPRPLGPRGSLAPALLRSPAGFAR